MRIMIFNWRCFRHPQAGGSELYLHKQAENWVKNGHEVIWYTSRPAGLSRREVCDGIQFVRAGGPFSVYPAATWNYLVEPKPDVVIDVENGIPFFTPLFCRRPKVLLIHHIHTNVWKREAGARIARIGKWLEETLMPWLYRKVPIVTVSQSSADMIHDLFNVHLPIEIVYNAISPDLVPGERAEKPEMIYLGRLRKYKSIDVLLRAIAQLPELNPVLHIVGQGEDRERLQQLAETLGLEKVLFHGFVDQSEKIRLLQRSWLAVNPSSMEGWGITNIEANACGVPVVGSDVPGIRDSIADGKSGVLVPYGDVDALTRSIEKLMNNEEYRNGLSRSAVEWARGFSWDASANCFMNVLEKTIAGGRT